LSPSGSGSAWIGQLKGGDPEAAQKLWERYFRRLVELARKRLQGVPRSAADEEDVALSAFDSFCRGAARGQFPRLDDRTDLWRLLVVLTARKACHLRRDECRQKRGGNKVVAPPLGPSPAGPTLEPNAELETIASREPSPEFAAEVAEECRRLFTLLDDDELQTIALWRMEGHTTAEIAGRLECARSTVERRLRLIRSLWKEGESP
jgi:DNA-directed RNA polymerase specialized sigma24 family protein